MPDQDPDLPSPAAVAAAVAARLPLRTARELSRTLMDMMARGTLPPGTRMPTVRALAQAVGMSPASVAVAWRDLAAWQAIATSRRGGTVVHGPPTAPRATRFDAMRAASERGTLNLGHIVPDRRILPPLLPALTAALARPPADETPVLPMTPALQAAAEAAWPFEAGAWVATHGSLDAIELALRIAVRPGDRVVVESPGLPRVLDILDAVGARTQGVEYGPEGPDLAQLARALQGRPVAFIYQPAGSQPCGRAVSSAWQVAAARLLAGTGIAVIELLQAPALLRRPTLSLGTALPDTTLHIQSHHFLTGTDIRVACVGGSAALIEPMRQQLTYASRWVSRLAQDALAYQLTDRAARAHNAAFARICRRRIARFTRALRAEGFTLEDHDGPILWLPVADEDAALARLYADGLVAFPGRHFHPSGQLHRGGHLVLNGTQFDDPAPMAARLGQVLRGL